MTPEPTDYLEQLLAYLGLGDYQKELLQEITAGEFEIYGHLPLATSSSIESYRQINGQPYDFMSSQIKENILASAVYIGAEAEEEATLEFHTPSRILHLEQQLDTSLLHDLCTAYEGEYHFLSLAEMGGLWESGSEDPGEYLTVSLPTSHVSDVLHDKRFLEFVLHVGNALHTRMDEKISCSKSLLNQLASSRFTASDCDYLDIRNLSRDFFSMTKPSLPLPPLSKMYHFNRHNGSIQSAYQLEFNAAEGKAMLESSSISPEEREEVHAALMTGHTYYSCQFAVPLLRSYLDSSGQKGRPGDPKN